MSAIGVEACGNRDAFATEARDKGMNHGEIVGLPTIGTVKLLPASAKEYINSRFRAPAGEPGAGV